MEKQTLLSKLEKAAPGRILQHARFGRTQGVSVWVEKSALAEIARALRDDPELRLDWLENLSVAQMGAGGGADDEALVLTYFLRSTETEESLVLRASVDLARSDQWVEAPSIIATWPMAAPFEQEASELFGIRFTGGASAGNPAEKVNPGWTGFPMRKNYVFPYQVFGITHSRSRYDS